MTAHVLSEWSRVLRHPAFFIRKGREMSKNKYFVVASSQLALKQTSGVKGSKLFAFKTSEEAEACMIEHQLTNREKQPNPVVKPKPIAKVKNSQPTAPVGWYVDGAYFPMSGQGYYGVVTKTVKDYDVVPPHYLALQSYGAELYACKRAIELAFANDVSEVQLYSDNTSVIYFIKNQCAKPVYQEAEQEMKYFFDIMNQFITIEIEHITIAPATAMHKKAHLLCQHGRLFLQV